MKVHLGETVSCILAFLCLTLVDCRQKRMRPRICKPSPIDVESAAGVKVEAISSSKVYMDTFKEPFGDDHYLKFDFKTTSANGTLFYMNRRNDEYDMVSGEIIDGFLEFKIRCKSSYADLRISRIRVSDGEWHEVEFRRKHRKGIFLLDGWDFLGKYYVGCGGFTSLNIGNTDPEYDSSVSVNELKIFSWECPWARHFRAQPSTDETQESMNNVNYRRDMTEILLKAA